MVPTAFRAATIGQISGSMKEETRDHRVLPIVCVVVKKIDIRHEDIYGRP